VRRVLAARIAKLLGLQTVGVLLLVFRRRVVAVFAIPALQRNGFPHALSLFLIPFTLRPRLIEAEGR
jgi:hypothetical protein